MIVISENDLISLLLSAGWSRKFIDDVIENRKSIGAIKEVVEIINDPKIDDCPGY